MPKSDDMNSISNLGGEYTDYYCVYFASPYFDSEFYMQYGNNLEKYIEEQYSDNTVKYRFAMSSYQRDGEIICYTKYSYETPYNIVNLHIEHPKEDRQTVYLASSISAKVIASVAVDSELTAKDAADTNSDKTKLIECLRNIRDAVIESIKEINDEYYDDKRLDCAIEYAMDHC